MATEVWTAADLNNVRNNLSGDYIQMANIDLSGYSWNPISRVEPYFSGSYDGCGYKISNLTTVASSPEEYSTYGLFGVTDGATLKNITIVDASVSGTTEVGILAGVLRATSCVNCHVTGTISDASYSWEFVGVGGLVGLTGTDSSLNQCCAVVDINAVNTTEDYADVYGIGGLVGYFREEINNCYARGTITIGSNYRWYTEVGGLAGWVGGNVTNCYAANDFNLLASEMVGEEGKTNGLIGWQGYAVVTNSYYDADLSGMSDTGHGEPRSTAEMTYPENFTTTYSDWDFSAVWRSDTAHTINDGYPYFGAGFNIWVKKSGVWEPVTGVWVKKSGSWQTVSAVSVKKSGSWKPI